MPDIDALIRAQQGDPSGLTGPAPAATATPQAPPGGNDIMSILPQLLSLPQISSPLSAQEVQRRQLQDLNQQRADMPIPQTAPKNPILRALLNITGPGRAINAGIYGPGVQQYQAKTKQLADQIASIKDQSGISQDEARNATTLAGTAGMAGYRTGQLQLGAERNQIAQQKADTFKQSVQNHLQVALRGLDLNALRTGSQIEMNKSRIALNSVLQQVLPQRVEVEQYGIDTNAYVRQAVADLEAQAGLEKTHPFLNMLDQTLGTSLMPSAPQTPSGAQPERGSKPLPQKTAPKSPAQPKGKVLVEGKDF